LLFDRQKAVTELNVLDTVIGLECVGEFIKAIPRKCCENERQACELRRPSNALTEYGNLLLAQCYISQRQVLQPWINELGNKRGGYSKSAMSDRGFVKDRTEFLQSKNPMNESIEGLI
jgi:hypothetical protein